MKNLKLIFSFLVLILLAEGTQAQVLLESQGGLKLGTTTITGDGIIRFHNGDYEAWKSGVWQSLFSAGTGGSGHWTQNGNNIYNSNAGNVGIGLTDAQAKLHVKGNGQVLSLEGSTNSYLAYYPEGYSAGRKGWVGFGSSSSDINITNQYSSGRIILKTNGFNRLFVGSNGFVGIGRPSPDQRLHVGGKIKSSYNGTSGEYIEMWHGGGNGFINTAGDGNLDFRHDNNTLMSLLPDGKLTIVSVATPGNYNLYVENGILTEEVKVALENTADWSDDEFDNVPELKIMETTIEEKSHLFGMPSAQELVDKGYSVTDMDSKLLAQIEWLWMHLIDESKKNMVLEERVLELERLIISSKGQTGDSRD